MPVVDLADYLGMPAQAPQQPMFQTTQRMAPALSQADLIRRNMAAFETLGNLQRLAPEFQAQQAQLAYDTVAQQARDLRMKQEIEAQAERAVNEMIGAGVTPESADYSTRMRDLVTRNPLALRDPGFQQISGMYDEQSRAFQQAREAEMASEAAYQKALNEDILRATEAGVDPRLLQGVQDRQMVAYLKSQLPRGGGAGMPDEARRLEKRAELKAKQLAAFGEYPDLEDPEYQEARLAAREAQDAWDNYLQTGVVPSATVPQATTQTVRPPLQAAANTGGQVVVPAPPPQAAPPPVSPIQQINLEQVPWSEIPGTLQRKQETTQEQEQINKAWFDAQMDLEKKLQEKYKGNFVIDGQQTNYPILRRFAQAVLNEETVPDPDATYRGEQYEELPANFPVWYLFLKEQGLLGKTAFRQPGDKRIGTEEVKYDELIKVWARNYLERSAQTMVPEVPAIDANRAKKADEFLNSWQK